MTAGFYARAAQPFHEVAHRQPLTDALRGVQLATRIDHADPIGHQNRRQRDVGCDHDIASHGMLRDVRVGHIGATVHAHRRELGISHREDEPLIRDKDRLERETITDAITHLFHIARGGIGIEPECRHRSIYMNGRKHRGAESTLYRSLRLCALRVRRVISS